MAAPNYPFGGFGAALGSGAGEAQKANASSFSFGAPPQSSAAPGAAAPPSFVFGQSGKPGLSQPASNAASGFGALGSLLSAPTNSQPFGQALTKPTTAAAPSFGFGTSASNSQSSTVPNVAAGFSFGASGAGGAGFSFGTPGTSSMGATTTASLATGGSTQTSGFGFGLTSTPSSSFGSGAVPVTGFGTLAGSSAGAGIGFGAAAASSAPTLVGAAPSTTAAPAAVLTAAASATGSSLFGGNVQTSAAQGLKPTAVPGFSFGGVANTAAPSLTGSAAPSLGGSATTMLGGAVAPVLGGTSGLAVGSSAAPAVGGFTAPSLGGLMPTTAPSTAVSFALPSAPTTTASAALGFSFGNVSAASSGMGNVVAPAPASSGLVSFLSSTPATSSVPTVAAGSGSTLGFSLGNTPAISLGSSSGTAGALTMPSLAIGAATTGSSSTATASALPSFGVGSSSSVCTASSALFGSNAISTSIGLGATQQSGVKLGGSVSAPAAGGSMGLGGLAGISSKPEVSASTSAALLAAKSTTTSAPATTTTTAATVTTSSLPIQESGGAVTTAPASTAAPSTMTSAGLPLGLPSSSGTTTSAAAAAVANAQGSTTTQEATAAGQVGSMTYKDLEEYINKWSHEFEEQERIFLQQATQINAWDRLLVENGEKITELNADVDNVKIDQQRLSSELDFIVSQQKELEEMLVPLEKAFEQLPASITASSFASSHLRHADLEREHTYQMAVNIDAQLKRLVEEMREVVDHLNGPSIEASKESDPTLQITKILGAHMDSLQWIDRSMETLQKKVGDASRLSEQLRRDQERSFRLAYS